MTSCTGCMNVGVENCVHCVEEDLYGISYGVPQTERAASGAGHVERVGRKRGLDAAGQRGRDAGVREPAPADGCPAGGDLPGSRGLALAGGGVRPDEPARAEDLQQDPARGVARERGGGDTLGGSGGAHKRLIFRELAKTAAVWAACAAAVALAAWLMFTACGQFPAFRQMMIKVADFTGAALSLLLVVIIGMCILRFD